jgi:hypothetical protein
MNLRPVPALAGAWPGYPVFQRQEYIPPRENRARSGRPAIVIIGASRPTIPIIANQKLLSFRIGPKSPCRTCLPRQPNPASGGRSAVTRLAAPSKQQLPHQAFGSVRNDKVYGLFPKLTPAHAVNSLPLPGFPGGNLQTFLDRLALTPRILPSVKRGASGRHRVQEVNPRQGGNRL